MFSADVAGLPEAVPAPIVKLADGERYTLTAAPVKQRVGGRWIRRLAYNGSIPGPVLLVAQGAKAFITLKNGTEVPTTLHSHGLRVDEKNDGVPGIGQAPIEPGGSYDYTLTFPDAGMFWYHPHIREDYTQDAGLYGNFWVTAADRDFYNPVHRELPIVLDDALLRDPKPYFKDRTTHTLMGRFGDVLLVNGVDTFELAATAGEVIRFFVTNTANTRVFALRIPGVTMKLVGGDAGLYERETWVESVEIAPSERYIVEVRMPQAGVYELVNDNPKGRVVAGKLRVAPGRVAALERDFSILRAPPAAAESLRAIKGQFALAPAHTLKIEVAMDHKTLPMAHGGHGAPVHGSLEWDDEMPAMNAQSDDRNVVWKMVDAATGLENMAVNWVFKKGTYAKIRIVNPSDSMHPMQHPIHFHGQRFVVAAVDGKARDNLVWKDSALVRTGETVDLIMEASGLGRWMAHCHIAEHLSAGMMIGFKVVN